MALIVARHGQTAWNRSERFQGWADIPMDREGMAQAARLAAAVAERPDVGCADPLVLTSDLVRARRTATILAAALGTTVVVDPALREVDVGAWQGLTPVEAAALFPDQYSKWETDDTIRRWGGETIVEAGLRVAHRIETALGGSRLVIVIGHGRSLQSGLRVLRDRGVVILPGEVPRLSNGEYLWLRCESEVGAPLE